MMLLERIFCSLPSRKSFHQLNVWCLLFGKTYFYGKFHIHSVAKSYFEDHAEGLHRFDPLLVFLKLLLVGISLIIVFIKGAE